MLCIGLRPLVIRRRVKEQIVCGGRGVLFLSARENAKGGIT
jgi:hypothetical protein